VSSRLNGRSPEERQKEREWLDIRDAIIAVMDQHGKRSFDRDGDYDLQDISAGLAFQSVIFKTLRLLQIDILWQLQDLLQRYPKAYIKIVLDLPDADDAWPAMGFNIFPDRIDDHLIRQSLPVEYRNVWLGNLVAEPLVSQEEEDAIIYAAHNKLFSNRLTQAVRGGF